MLYRDNREAAPLARVLEKEHVPFNIESDQDVLGDLEIKKLIRILRAVEHFGSDVSLAEALHVDFLGIPPIDVYKLAAFARRERIKIYDVCDSEALLDEAGVRRKRARHVLQKSFRMEKRREKRGRRGCVRVRGARSGFLAALSASFGDREDRQAPCAFRYSEIVRGAAKNYTLDDFFAYLDLMEKHDVAIKEQGSRGDPGPRPPYDRAPVEGPGVRLRVHHERRGPHVGFPLPP